MTQFFNRPTRQNSAAVGPGYRSRILNILACCLVFGGGGSLTAQDAAAPPVLLCPDRTIGAVLPPAPDRSQSPMVIFARTLDAEKSSIGDLTGRVEIFRADQYLATERVQYDPSAKTVAIPGAMDYRDQQVWIKGQGAFYDFRQEAGYFTQINYGLTGSSANGSADRAELSGGTTSRFHNMEYSTCPADKPDWLLSANEVELRHDKGFGVARGATLEFKGIPILYAPYFSFPIDGRRKSGFLYPSFGNTNDNGLEFNVPWYWNIAPNQDATIEPRYLTSRGVMLGGEYRLMTPRSYGTVEFDYLPDDRKTDDSRARYRVEQTFRPWARWRTHVIAERVGDDEYFQDFGSSLTETAIQFLRSSATLSGVGRYWNLDVLVDDFQVIDQRVLPANEPFRRLPRIAFALDRPLWANGPAVSMVSEFVYFDRGAGTTGARFDALPRIYWQHHSSWGFVKPALGYRFTAYDLDRDGAPGSESPSRGTSIVSVDSGLYFDRTNANGSTQTLEPRLFYLYVPNRQQEDLPLFDTGEFTFGFSQLFNTNRFAGADRQSDAKQISAAISTRNYDSASGRVKWSLNLGQIFYLQSLRVQLDDQPAQTSDYSPFIAELNWHPFMRFSARTGVQWDWQTDRLSVASFGFSFAGDRGRRASLDYRFRRERVDQFDLRLFWPVNEQWRVLSRFNYSFQDDDILEVQGGVEYESCCWALRTVLRRYLRNREGDFRNGIFVELNLKGLASLGTRAQELFNY